MVAGENMIYVDDDRLEPTSQNSSEQGKLIPNFQRFSSLRKQYGSFSLKDQKFKLSRLMGGEAGVVLGYDSEMGELVVDGTDTHTLVYGATGSLKTRCVVLPTMKLLGFGQESMIINDSKGELYDHMAGFLETQGYQIKVINFRNPLVGNSWNPFYIPFQYYLNGDLDRAAEFANDIAGVIALSQISHTDPFWDYSAYDCILGLILLLFRFCKEKQHPVSCVNVSNLIRLRRELFLSGTAAKHSAFWQWAKQDELIAASLSGSVNAPNDTMNSILSVVDQKLRAFSIQPALLDMLANNDISIADIGEEKTAVFLITPDEKTTYHRLVSLFVKQSYEYLIYVASMGNSMVSRRVNYILDEFSTLPAISDFSAMISAARSRNIRFLLVSQSKNQLVHKYQEEALTIAANCANWIFLTSRELDLLRDISELCGKNKQQMPNISVFDLQHFSKERAEALILVGRNRPCKVRLLDIDRFNKTCGGAQPSPAIQKQPRQDRIHLNFKMEPPEEQKPQAHEFSFSVPKRAGEKEPPDGIPRLTDGLWSSAGASDGSIIIRTPDFPTEDDKKSDTLAAYKRVLRELTKKNADTEDP